MCDIEGNHLTSAAILGHDGSVWAQSASFPKVGLAPALNKAEVPWSARRGTFSSKDHALKTVKGILNKPTPKKFDLLKRQLIDSGITTADILKRTTAEQKKAQGFNSKNY